jgi:hypothetical protein
MQLSSHHSYDAETVAFMGALCDEAWHVAQSQLALPEAGDPSGLRELVALRIMAAVANGERNPEPLRLMALASLDA